MPNTIPEIATLLREVEKKYGRKVSTSTDFESLSVVIERDINEYISASTLKRLWGYVSLKPAPRVATLDVLSRFCGCTSFADFREKLKNLPDSESDFFSTMCISSADLTIGEMVLIGWAPNRLVKLQYLGDDGYMVVESHNAKLLQGDVFRATHFLLDYPLYIDHIDRADGPTPSYVAGKTGGLNRVERG
jgi:hypothetical protein